MSGRDVTYDRPVKATLHVHLDNGETWEATLDDLTKWGLDYTLDVYMRFNRALNNALRTHGLLDGDLTDAQLNPVRHLAELAIRNPELLDHPENDEWRKVADIERRLQRGEDS